MPEDLRATSRNSVMLKDAPMIFVGVFINQWFVKYRIRIRIKMEMEMDFLQGLVLEVDVVISY